MGTRKKGGPAGAVRIPLFVNAFLAAHIEGKAWHPFLNSWLDVWAPRKVAEKIIFRPASLGPTVKAIKSAAYQG